ncbi:MAG: hypothetical protein ABWY12_08895 [Burkholderiales bacterium]
MLTHAVKTLPMATPYAVWTGIFAGIIALHLLEAYRDSEYVPIAQAYGRYASGCCLVKADAAPWREQAAQSALRKTRRILRSSTPPVELFPCVGQAPDECNGALLLPCFPQPEWLVRPSVRTVRRAIALVRPPGTALACARL